MIFSRDECVGTFCRKNRVATVRRMNFGSKKRFARLEVKHMQGAIGVSQQRRFAIWGKINALGASCPSPETHPFFVKGYVPYLHGIARAFIQSRFSVGRELCTPTTWAFVNLKL